MGKKTINTPTQKFNMACRKVLLHANELTNALDYLGSLVSQLTGMDITAECHEHEEYHVNEIVFRDINDHSEDNIIRLGEVLWMIEGK